MLRIPAMPGFLLSWRSKSNRLRLAEMPGFVVSRRTNIRSILARSLTRETAMKTSWVLVLCIAMAGTLAYGQSGDAGYQTATVVSIDKVAADARHPEKAGEYKVAMRMGNTLYMCQSSASPAAFLDWSPNK